MSSTVDDLRRNAADADPSDAKVPARVHAVDRARAIMREHWPAFALAALAAAIALLARHLLYPAYSYNRDEPVFLWMADHLRSGILRPTDGGFPQFFQPWLSAHRDGAFFTHFTLGWPLVLVASEILFGVADAAPALGAALVVLGTYALARELTSDRSLAVVAAALMALSPIIAVQGGLYLGYLFTTGLGLLFAAALISGLRLARTSRIVLAGALLGLVFLTRPFDAVLWAVPVIGYVVLVHWRDGRRLLRAVFWGACGALPFIVVALLYNRAVVGHITELPNSAADPLDKFGFGVRRMMPAFEGTLYPVSVAIKSTLKDGFRVPLFLAGGYLGLVFAALGAWHRRAERSTQFLLAMIACFPVAYFFHWGSFISSLVATWGGPIYLVPLYGPLCILLAAWVVTAWRGRRRLAVGVLVALVVVTVPVAVNRFAVVKRISDAQRPWKASGATIKGRALVFVADSSPYLMFYNPFSSNDPKLQGRILYAADRGPENLDLISKMGDRTPYVQQAEIVDGEILVAPDHPALFPPSELQAHNYPRKAVIRVERIHVVKGGVISLRLRVHNPDGKRVVRAYIDVGDGGPRRWVTLTQQGRAGRTYTAGWTLVAPGRKTHGVRGDARLLPSTRLGTVTVGVAYGSSASAITRPVARQRIDYRLNATTAELMLSGNQQRARRLHRQLVWYQQRTGPDDFKDFDLEMQPASLGPVQGG